MPWTLGHSDIMDIIHEIETASPRVAVIVGVSLLDECLTEALKLSVRPMTKPEEERIFGDRGSVRDFSLKVDLGYAFSLYGPLTFLDLRKMRDMRNKLAHKTRIRDFSNQPISGLCRDLKMLHGMSHAKGYVIPKEARRRFIETVSIISETLRGYVFQKKRGKPWPSNLP